MGHAGTQPAIQSLHTDYTSWASLNNTGVESFYAQIASEPYKPQQSEFLTHVNVGDFRLTREIGHSSSYDYCTVYEEIPATNQSSKKIVFALKGSNTLWDYITDASLLHDYSTEGVSTVFDHLYEYLLNLNYNVVVNYMDSQAVPTFHQYCLVGHSLGGKLAYDIYTRLVDNNLGTNFSCRLFNPYTLLTERYVDSLQKVQNAVDGVEGFDRFNQLKQNVHQYICRGDMFAQTAIWWGPGQIKTYPAIETITDPDNLSLSSIGWNASKEMANHKLLNFYESQPHTTTMHLRSKTFFDGTGENAFDGAQVIIVNRTEGDFSIIRDAVGQHHVKVRALTTNFADVKGNLFYGAIPVEDYQWSIDNPPGEYHCYDEGNARAVTPVYIISNKRNDEQYVQQTVFFKYNSSVLGLDYYNIVKLASNNAFTDSNSVLTVPAYNAQTLYENLDTGVTINTSGYAQTAALVEQAAIDRRLFSFVPAAVLPIQGEGEVTWQEDETRRLIHDSLANPLTDPAGKSIGFTYNSLDNGQGWDAYDIDFALYDIGGGVLKWGHIDVGDYNNYKVILDDTTGDDRYLLKSNSWTSGAMYTPEYEIVYYDTTRYMIKNTDVLNNGKYLKRPTPSNTLLSTTTSAMMYQNSSAYFIAMEWDVWDGLTGSPDDYLFHINSFVQPIPRQLGSSLANHDAAGNLIEKHLFYPNYMKSPDGQYILTFQRDGNLALFSNTGTVIYTSGTFYAGNGLFLQLDGNAVIYDGGSKSTNVAGPVRWASGTSGKIIFSVTNAGKILITDDQDNDLWFRPS